MIERQTWIEHKFNLGIHPGWSHNIIERIRDNEIRIRHHFASLPDSALIFKPNGKWSIKEHIGHLIDLEDLHIHRLYEFLEGKETLSAADMSNLRTEDSNHNDMPFEQLMERFSNERARLIEVFADFSQEIHEHEAIHPRLKVIMKPVDLMFFVGEHDDHHICSMLKIKSNLT